MFAARHLRANQPPRRAALPPQVSTYCFRWHLRQTFAQALRRSQTVLSKDVATLLQGALALLKGGVFGLTDMTATIVFHAAKWTVAGIQEP